MDIKKPYLLFLGDVADQLSAKTAQGVVDWRPQDCVGQLRLAGCDADVGVPDSDLEDAIAQGAKTLLIGVANSGGYLPEHWRETIVQAIESGLDVAQRAARAIGQHQTHCVRCRRKTVDPFTT